MRLYAFHNRELMDVIDGVLNPWGRVLIEKLSVTQLVKKLPAVYGIQRFITVFTSAPPLVPNLIQTHPVHTLPTYVPKIHSNIIFRLCLCLPRDLFPSDFPTKFLHSFLISPIRATCPTNIIPLCLDHTNNIW